MPQSRFGDEPISSGVSRFGDAPVEDKSDKPAVGSYPEQKDSTLTRVGRSLYNTVTGLGESLPIINPGKIVSAAKNVGAGNYRAALMDVVRSSPATNTVIDMGENAIEQARLLRDYSRAGNTKRAVISGFNAIPIVGQTIGGLSRQIGGEPYQPEGQQIEPPRAPDVAGGLTSAATIAALAAAGKPSVRATTGGAFRGAWEGASAPTTLPLRLRGLPPIQMENMPASLSGAATGAAAGHFVPGVGPVVGGTVGAAIPAIRGAVRGGRAALAEYRNGPPTYETVGTGPLENSASRLEHPLPPPVWGETYSTGVIEKPQATSTPSSGPPRNLDSLARELFPGNRRYADLKPNEQLQVRVGLAAEQQAEAKASSTLPPKPTIPDTPTPKLVQVGQPQPKRSELPPPIESPSDMSVLLQQSLDALKKNGKPNVNAPVPSTPTNAALSQELKAQAAETSEGFKDAAQTRRALTIGKWLKDYLGENVDSLDPKLLTDEHIRAAAREAGIDNPSSTTIQKVRDLFGMATLEIKASSKLPPKPMISTTSNPKVDQVGPMSNESVVAPALTVPGQIASGFRIIGSAFRENGRKMLEDMISKNGEARFTRAAAIDAIKGDPSLVWHDNADGSISVTEIKRQFARGGVIGLPPRLSLGRCS